MLKSQQGKTTLLIEKRIKEKKRNSKKKQAIKIQKLLDLTRNRHYKIKQLKKPLCLLKILFFFALYMYLPEFQKIFDLDSAYKKENHIEQKHKSKNNPFCI